MTERITNQGRVMLRKGLSHRGLVFVVSAFICGAVLMAYINSPSPTSAAVASSIPMSGLVGYFPFNGNADNGVGVDTGEVNGAVLTTDIYSDPNKSYSFDGSGYINVSVGNNFNFTNALTLAAWVYPTAVDGGVDIIVNKEDRTQNPIQYEMGIRGSQESGEGSIPQGNFAFHFGPDITGFPNEYWFWVDGGFAVPLNTWSHVAVTFDGSSAKTFLNGALKRTVSGLSGTILPGNGPLRIGHRSDAALLAPPGYPNEKFNGKIDEALIYRRALSAAEVQQIATIPVPEANIIADSASVVSGGSTVIRWCGPQPLHACAYTYFNDCKVGTTSGGSDFYAAGSADSCLKFLSTGALSADTTYYLTTTGPGGTNSAEVKVSVTAAAALGAPTLSINGSCPNINLSWTPVTGAQTYDARVCFGDGCTPAGQGACSATHPTVSCNYTQPFFEAGGVARFGVDSFNSVDGTGPLSNIVESRAFCTPDAPRATPNLNIKKDGILIPLTPVTGLFQFIARYTGTTKASGALSIQYGDGDGAAVNGGLNILEFALQDPKIGGAVIPPRVRIIASDTCDSISECRWPGQTTSYQLGTLAPNPTTLNPIDFIITEAFFYNSAGMVDGMRIGFFLSPGDFSLDTPTNTCIAGTTDAPVTLVWSASPAAEKYNVFRVHDEDRNGRVEQNEIESAIEAGTYNLNFENPLSPRDAQCDTDTSCTWTDESAKKNIPYFYIIRSRNSQGVTFSDSPVVNVLADYKPKAITPVCAPAATLAANPTPINLNDTSTLSWSATNADSCVIDQGVGTVCSGNCDGGTGTKPVQPKINTTYTLTCTGLGGPPATPSATVNINNQAPIAVAGVALPNDTGPRVYKGAPDNPLKVKKGVPLTLWFAPFLGTLEAPTSISRDPDDENNEPAKGIYDDGVCEWNDDLSVNNEEPNNFGTEINLPTLLVGSVNQPSPPGPFPRTCVRSASHTFNDAGGIYLAYRLTDKLGAKSTVAKVTIIAVPAPVITSFTATPNPINQDQAFSLAWVSTGTASCSSPDADFNTAIAGGTSGSATISDLRTSPKDYVLNCASADTDLYPTAATQTVTMTITAPVCTSFIATPATTLEPGDPSTLSWNVPNARTCTIDQGIGSVPVNSTKEVEPNVATTYTLACSGDGAPACSQPATVSINNQQSTAAAGASLDTSPTRTYTNTITVTQGAPVKVYLSAAGSADSDGAITSCRWNDDFNQDPPIDFEKNISVSPPATPITTQCDTVIQSISFPLPSETGSPLGDHSYQILTVTDDKNLASLPAVLHVNILPQLGVSLTANPAGGDAPFSPTLRADVTGNPAAASDTGNFSIWWDCANTSSDLGVVMAACGQLPSDPSGDRVCTANAVGAKCDGVPLQGQEFLTTVVDPAYPARATAYTPKVIVERGAARSAEARASATANTPYAYTLAKTGGDIDAVKGASGNTTIAFDHTGGAAQRVDFSCSSGLPVGAVCSFTPSNCTNDCATTMSISTTASTPAGNSAIIVSGSVAGGTTASVGLTVRDTLSCAPTTQTAIIGVPTSPITAAGGTGTNLWEVFHPSNLLTRDPNASPNTGSGATFSTTFNTTGTGRIIRVTSGTQTKECSADVIGQTLDAAISAVPNTGTAPLASTITGQITSGSTAVGTINYSFWWDCDNDGANVTNVINGTGSGAKGVIACGNPEGPTPNLATNYPSITCKGNDKGAKCFVDPAAVPAAEAFNPVTKPLQVAHSYAGKTTPYIPKVIIERGSASADEARTSVNASFPALTASCAVAPTSVITGVNITWTATPGGGSGTYSYAWTGDVPLQGRTGNPAVVSYSTASTKNGSVTVTDSSGAARTASCTNSVVVSLPPNGAPVAVAGISKDTSSSRAYSPSVDVKFGIATPLYFSAFIGTKASPTAGQVSNDSDGWATPEGVSAGGHCDWNVELSQASPPAYPNGRITSPASATACEASRSNPISSPYTFNDLPENDAQISRALTYNILQITDNRATVSNDGQASVVVHYQPSASLSADKTSVNAGAPVVLTWGSTHATSCTGTGFSTGAASPVSGSVTVNPAADTTYQVSCSGSALWGATESAPVTVTMASTYSLTASRDIAIVQGATVGNTNVITIRRDTGSSQASVSLAAGGLPAGATVSFVPLSCSPVSAPCPSTLAIATSRGADATPPGTYPITVTGSVGATPVATITFNLVITSQMSVSLAAIPSPSGPAPYVLQLKADAPAVDYTGKPEDKASYWFWKNCDNTGTDVATVTSVCGTQDFKAENTPDLSITTTDLIYTQQGTYHGKVIARRGTAVAEDRIIITVNPPFGYTLSLDRSRIEMVQGTTISSANRATITHESGTPVSLTFGNRVGGIPASAPNPAISFSPSSCTPPVGGACGADISVGVSRDLPAGDYPVTVSAGSKNASFTLGVLSRISAALTALPKDSGPAPLSVQLKADTSGYTGSPNDALNYSFWWNCNNPTDNTADAKIACGDPQDGAIGYKTDGTLQESLTTPSPHVYATEGVYFAKMIVERGGARREARIPITVGTPKVSVSCSASPASAVINQPVTWTAMPARGAAPYGFNWTRDVSCGINPQQCAAVEMRYASAGDKFGNVTVTDGNGDTASRLCDNAVKIYQPTLVIVPATAQIRADGDTMQFAAKYDPDGPDGSQPEQTVTATATWSIPLSEQSRAAVSAGGLVTTRAQIGSVTLSASFRDGFNNVIVATAGISVISRDALVCDPATQTVRTGEATFPMKASGGTGSYDWLAQETDATPRAGSTAGNQTFATTFSATGNKTITVTSGSQSGSCKVAVTDQNLVVNLSAFPTSVVVPQPTRLTAVVSGNALGTMNYSYWWNCGNDKDADNTARVEIAEGRCGEIPHNVPAGQCEENQFGMACRELSSVSKAIDHGYADAGAKKPKVIVERGNASPAQAKADVSVDAANAAPDAIAGISADQNATRIYARSIVVTQNVPTKIYFAGFTGKVNAVDEKSTDPNGWANELNGVSHPNNPTAAGQCAWNADLDRDAQVSFEDVSGTNRNPASEKECVTSFVHNFAEIGTHTYAVLRITDNRSAVSDAALVTVDVVSPGAPVAMPGASNDPSAERIYKETVRVKQGENTELWVSARRRVGATDVVSSDPDEWQSRNGGVAKGGSCRWNRDLDKGVFPTGVPTYEYVINDPQDPSEDCDTKIVNEAGNSFVRVFNDIPRDEPYSFEALRIFDNTGLRSNKGMLKVQVLPSDPPVAAASASTDNGATFNNVITVARGAPTPIIFSAAGSTDPDGWTNPVNGVSVSGQCDWNADLDRTTVTFENAVQSPASPSACNLMPRIFTFNDRPGIIDFQVLKIVDNKGFASTPASVSVRVTAPDLVVSQGPLPTVLGALAEKSSTAFTGKIKNQGDAETTATFQATFSVDIGNDGSADLTLAPSPSVAGLATGGEKEVSSGVWSNLPAGTHKVTLCADQPGPAVVNEFFTENNCSSQVITVIPDNRSPVAEAGISLDGITYGASITVLKGAPVEIWLSADKDATGDGVASFDPDGWADALRGVAAGGKCEWNLDLASVFSVQNTVNNPASPAICNRNRMDKTFNDPVGTYIYPVLRITDAKLGQSNVANVSVRVVDSVGDLKHIDCVAEACTVVSGAGANVCAVPGGACTGGFGLPSGDNRSDLIISESPHRASGKLEEGKKATFAARVKNQGVGAVTLAFNTAFLVDLGNNGTIDARLPVPSRTARVKTRAQLAALPINDLVLPLPASLSELAAGADAPVESGEWRNIPVGTHRVIVCADSDNGVSEMDEANNCDSVVVIVPPSSSTTGPLRVDSCSASPRDVRAGEFVDWSATVSGGTGAYSFSWSGDAPLEGATANPVSVKYQTQGTKSGSVIVTSGNETASRNCGNVNVAPGILSFNANPTRINPGQSSLLSWSTTGFSSCAITADQSGQSLGAVPTNGTQSVQPSQNTRYTLTCSGANQSQSVTVVVSSQPIIQETVPH